VSDDENSILLNSGANLRVTTERVEECAELIAATDVLVLQGDVPPRPSRPQSVTFEGRFVNCAPAIRVDSGVPERADPFVVSALEVDPP